MAYTHFTDTTLTTRVRYLINEPTALTVEDSEIQAWFKQAAMEISKNRLVERIKEFQMTQNDYEIALSGSPSSITDCYDIETVMYLGATQTASGTTTRCLLKMHPRQIAHVKGITAVTVPTYWYYENGNLGIYPAISAASKWFKIFYYALVYDWEDNGNGDYFLPEWSEEYMVFFALSKYFDKMGKPNQANQYMSYFNKFLLHHRIDQFIKPTDSKDMLKTPDYTKVG